MLIETLSLFPSFSNAIRPRRSWAAPVRAACSILPRTICAIGRMIAIAPWTMRPLVAAPACSMKIEPLHEAICDISSRGECPPRVVFFTPCGEPFTQEVAERLSACDRILFRLRTLRGYG